MARVVDYIAPMLYPSLWARGEFDLEEPEAEPFQIVSRSLEYFEAAIAGTGAQLLPWLQDYSMARAYGTEEVGAQIEAARLARTRGWLLWNAGGAYTLSALKRVVPRRLRPHGVPQSARQWELRGKLELWTTGLGGRVGIAVKDLRTGETVSLRGDEIFPVRGVEALPGAQTIDPASTTVRAQAKDTARTTRSTSGRQPPRRTSSRPRRFPRSPAPVGRTWTTPLELARLLERAERGRGARPTTGSHTVNGGSATPAAYRRWSGDARATFGVFDAAGGPVAVVVLTEPWGAAYDASRRLTRQIVRYLDDYDSHTAEEARQRSPFCSSNPFRATRDGPLAGKTIILDPGHGGRDSGARFVFGDGVRLKESHVVLEVALRLTRLLQSYGATVELTRCRDAYVPLRWRTDFANRRESADLFLSIHVNGSVDKQTNATEAYYASPSVERAARYLFGTYTTLGLWGTLNSARRLEKGGVHERAFVVLRETRVPSVLTESVYLTNPQEAAALRWSRRGRSSRVSEIVRGHLRGILNYFGHPEPVRPAAVPRALRARLSARETARFASLDAVAARLTALGYAMPRRSSAWRYDASPSGRGYGSFGFPFGASVRRGRPYETLASDLTDAVYAFQKVQGLPRTGVVDADTRAALRFPRVPAPRHASPSDHLEVDKTRQVLYVIRNGRIRTILPISTAAAGVDFTPEGRFSIYRKRPGFDPSPLGTLFQPLCFVGPYAIHGSPSVPPYPASHGCVRVPMWAARDLYQGNPFGETVYVY
jgi:N-acetylmuramoyl-L-alanine amidase